jgi:hypothetical protein
MINAFDDYLLFDQLHAAVLCPAFLCVVRRDGRKLTTSEGPQAGCCYAIIVNQSLDDCLGTTL